MLFFFPTFTLDLRLGDIADSRLDNVYIYYIQSVNCFSSMGEGDYSTNAWTYMLLVALALTNVNGILYGYFDFVNSIKTNPFDYLREVVVT